MNCVGCLDKGCRTLNACGTEKFDQEIIRSEYQEDENENIIKVAAELVDNGRAGNLSRLQEIIEFIKKMNYNKTGLDYCYGIEKDAKLLKEKFKRNGLKLSTVSCTVGGVAQDEVNENSCIHKVSCNPLGQAHQLNSEENDFVIIMGICLGHDILLQRNLKCDFTTFVVKDRIHGHNPLAALRN